MSFTLKRLKLFLILYTTYKSNKISIFYVKCMKWYIKSIGHVFNSNEILCEGGEGIFYLITNITNNYLFFR